MINFLIFATVMDVRFYLIIVLTYALLIIIGFEHISIHLLAIWISPFVLPVFKLSISLWSFLPFSVDFQVLFLYWKINFYALNIFPRLLSIYYFCVRFLSWKSPLLNVLKFINFLWWKIYDSWSWVINFHPKDIKIV